MNTRASISLSPWSISRSILSLSVSRSTWLQRMCLSPEGCVINECLHIRVGVSPERQTSKPAPFINQTHAPPKSFYRSPATTRATAASRFLRFCQRYRGATQAKGSASRSKVNHSPGIQGLGGVMSLDRKATRFVRPAAPRRLAFSWNWLRPESASQPPPSPSNPLKDAACKFDCMPSRTAEYVSTKIMVVTVTRMLLARYWANRSEGISNAARRSTLQSTARIRIDFVGRNSRAASKIAALQRVLPAMVEYSPASKLARMHTQANPTYRLWAS